MADVSMIMTENDNAIIDDLMNLISIGHHITERITRKKANLGLVYQMFIVYTTPVEDNQNIVCSMSSDQPIILSAEQKQFYEDNGFLVIKGLFDFTTLYNFKKRFTQICKGIVDKGNMTIVKERGLADKGVKGENLINKITEIHHDDVFITYTEHPRLIHLLAQFIGEDMRVMNSMFINKPPGSISHPPHQDLFYFPFRPAEKIIAAWTAVDDVTEENGCLYVVPGTHREQVLHPHHTAPGSSRLYHGISSEGADEGRVSLEMSPGDTVVFHPLLVHGSGPNHTPRARRCLTAHYASSSCWYEDVRGGVQDALAAEVEREAARRGYQLSFEDAWRYKSKAVARPPSKL